MATKQVVARLIGGLGNQMFQYAAAFALSKRDSRDLLIDTRWLDWRSNDPLLVKREYGLGIFNLSANNLESIEIKSGFRNAFGPSYVGRLESRITLGIECFGLSRFYAEPSFTYTEIPRYRLGRSAYLSGYFQSPKYFEEFKNELRNEFTFSEDLTPAEQEMQSKIEAFPSLCINVRRGDFVHNARSAGTHGSMDVAYFDRALRRSRGRVGHLPIFIFSDDIQWCERNLNHLGDVTFVSHKFAGKHFGTYLRLMSSCAAFIIPNSTFAWWAVWLSSTNNPTVIAPQRWFSADVPSTRDLIPPSWVRV